MPPHPPHFLNSDPRRGFAFPDGSSRSTKAFSLLELLVVIAIILILAAMVTPVMNSTGGAGNLTAGAYQVAEILERARAYAMANNTYVWVGFYEEDAGTTTPTSTPPPYTGKGQIVLATVTSLDGTKIDAATGNLTLARIAPIDRVVKIQSLHLTDLGAPLGGDPKSLNGRPNDPATDRQSLSSESANKAILPFAVQNYTFYKTIRFTPRGEASINGQDLIRVGEIGLRPTHGTTVDTNTPNVAAVQFTGIGGNVRIYRP